MLRNRQGPALRSWSALWAPPDFSGSRVAFQMSSSISTSRRAHPASTPPDDRRSRKVRRVSDLEFWPNTRCLILRREVASVPCATSIGYPSLRRPAASLAVLFGQSGCTGRNDRQTVIPPHPFLPEYVSGDRPRVGRGTIGGNALKAKRGQSSSVPSRHADVVNPG